MWHKYKIGGQHDSTPFQIDIGLMWTGFVDKEAVKERGKIMHNVSVSKKPFLGWEMMKSNKFLEMSSCFW